MQDLQATLEGFRDRMSELSQRFARQSARYRSSAYNEETARSEFISPFFEALGWDIANRQGHALQYRDVIHEEGIKVGDATKAPDYTFRIGGQRKFFVEAKKPGVDLKNDVAPAYQLRRYAWSAHLPLSILTDFEELAVYDTRIKPGATDKASVARVFYFGHEEYPAKAEEIWNIFSKHAVLEGSFDVYAEDNRKKRGTTEVDAEILKEIEGWREELAKNLALRNEGLTVDELNYAVQATIDRILFLRIAEGRGAEDYGRLLALTGGPEIYGRLIELYSKADERYNSGVFDFKADRLTLKLALDDKVLKPILKGLYYPESPYEFSVLPAEILGNVYEQFLGKVIRLTAGGRAKVEEKPEVKKAGGVYYTPRYIVDYIVAHTVGKLAEGKPPKEMAKLRIVDPACGSGSFLLAAYQKLLDVHLSWYREHEPKKHKNEVFEGQGGDWRLTTAKKREILLNSIYGVDIDRQAVEVSKLSLLLKCLEGETNETLRQMNLYGERALPSLEKNIQCGNSLISPEALRRSAGLFPDPDEERRINPFDWQQAFPEVFAVGGFDAVVGNPPYAYRNATEDLLRPVYAKEYRTAEGNLELYKFFLEKSLALARPGVGRVGMIVSATFLVQPSFFKLRQCLLASAAIEILAPLGPGAFEKATVDTVVLVAVRADSPSSHTVSVVRPKRPRDLPTTEGLAIRQSRFEANEGLLFDYRLADEGASLVGRLISSFPVLESGFELGVGINTGFIRDELVADTKVDSRYHRMVPGTGISRYGPVETSGWILYDAAYVKSQGKLGRSLPPERFFKSEKILVVRTRNLSLSRRIVATLDREQHYNLNRLSNIIARPNRSLLGLLAFVNSALFNWLYSTRFFDYEIKPVYLRSTPIADTEDKELCVRAGRMLSLQEKLGQARTGADQKSLQRQVEALDAEIDRLVYELYELSAEEIAIVEKG